MRKFEIPHPRGVSNFSRLGFSYSKRAVNSAQKKNPARNASHYRLSSAQIIKDGPGRDLSEPIELTRFDAAKCERSPYRIATAGRGRRMFHKDSFDVVHIAAPAH